MAARSTPTIYTQLLQAKNAQAALAVLTSASQVAIWNLWLWITATGQAIFEQLCDQFQANIETLIANAPVMTAAWIVAMCKYFQYNASNPQVVQVNVTNTYPFVSIVYPSVNPAYNVVTQAACVNYTNNQIIIKVTGASGPLDGSPGISGPICSALISFLNIILSPNLSNYILINDNADEVYIQAQIFYNASYSGVISANVQTAINNYCASLPFNGVFDVNALLTAILSVTGVNDCILNNVYWRKATDTAPSGGPPPTNEPNQLVNNNQLIARNYQTYAGYVIPETTSGYTLSSSLTFTAQ